jgi:hypothetical protein
MNLLVLVEQHVWDDFRPAVEALGREWKAPSGRSYRLSLTGRRLEIYLEHQELAAPPPEDLVDSDLFALAGQLYDAVGDGWSADALRQTAQAWGWAPGSGP